MAGKSGKSVGGYELPKFVICDLDVETKEQMKLWIKDDGRWFDVLAKAVDSGHKISVNADVAHKCVAAFCTGSPRGGGSGKLCLSARGPDFAGALAALAFKFSVVLDGDLGNAMKQDDAIDIWG